jgi:CBS domain-containing protein
MKLRDVMTRNPRTIEANASLHDAAKLMRDEDTGALPVVENGKPVGLLTDRDIVIRAVAGGESELKKPVRQFISGDLVTADPDMSTTEAADLMGSRQIRRLLVCEGDRLTGIVSLGDLAVKSGREREVGQALEEISEPTR